MDERGKLTTTEALDLRGRLQKQCVEWAAYWRAPDSHGVIITSEQAVALLEDALGVEVEITNPQGARVSDEMVERAEAARQRFWGSGARFNADPPEYGKMAMRAALTTLAAESLWMKWQPIETAPRDETRVLVSIPDYRLTGYIEIAWFGMDPNSSDGDDPCWLYGDGNDYSCGYFFHPCKPTHWMPLPPPPEAE